MCMFFVVVGCMLISDVPYFFSSPLQQIFSTLPLLDLFGELILRWVAEVLMCALEGF